MVQGSTQSLTEMSTRNRPGGKGQPARRADNLTAICEPIVYTKCQSLDVSQPYGSSWPVTGIALRFHRLVYGLIITSDYTASMAGWLESNELKEFKWKWY
jgi:hypothetical protein